MPQAGSRIRLPHPDQLPVQCGCSRETLAEVKSYGRTGEIIQFDVADAAQVTET
jgi:hypothetical protein